MSAEPGGHTACCYRHQNTFSSATENATTCSVWLLVLLRCSALDLINDVTLRNHGHALFAGVWLVAGTGSGSASGGGACLR